MYEKEMKFEALANGETALEYILAESHKVKTIEKLRERIDFLLKAYRYQKFEQFEKDLDIFD